MAVYRQDGRQRKEFSATFREPREIKIRRTAEEASRRAGPTLHAYARWRRDRRSGRRTPAGPHLTSLRADPRRGSRLG